MRKIQRLETQPSDIETNWFSSTAERICASYSEISRGQRDAFLQRPILRCFGPFFSPTNRNFLSIVRFLFWCEYELFSPVQSCIHLWIQLGFCPWKVLCNFRLGLFLQRTRFSLRSLFRCERRESGVSGLTSERTCLARIYSLTLHSRYGLCPEWATWTITCGEWFSSEDMGREKKIKTTRTSRKVLAVFFILFGKKNPRLCVRSNSMVLELTEWYFHFKRMWNIT